MKNLTKQLNKNTTNELCLLQEKHRQNDAIQIEEMVAINANYIFKYVVLALIIICNVCSTAQVSYNVPKNGLVAFWPFNGNANGQTQNPNNGVVYGASLTTDREGHSNRAYYFNGINDSIYFPAALYTPVDSNFTISYWFRSGEESKMQPLNMNDGGLFQTNFNFAINDGAYASYTYWNGMGNNSLIHGYLAELTDNNWQNMIVTRKDSVLSVYFNGILQQSSIYTSQVHINKAITMSGGTFKWKGEIDDIALYNRALTQAEIDTITVLNLASGIVVTSPVKTEAYPINSVCKIKWLYPYVTSNVNIQYSINNGVSWTTIVNNLNANLSEYDWVVPNLPGKTCKIRIKDANNNLLYDVSDDFQISKYQWQMVNTNAAFSVRDGAGAYVMRDTMYLVGGWNPIDPDNYPLITTNEVWRSTNGNTWDLIANAPWEPRHTFGTIVYNNKMWVLGGDQNQNHFQTDIWNSPDGINWNLVNANAPWGERVTHMTFVFNNKMWVMGGQKIVGAGINNTVDTVYNDVWNSSDGITWAKVSDSAGWAPRGQIEGSCVFNNKIWIMGGGTYCGVKKYFNDVWCSSDGINWTQVSADTPWKKRQYNEIASYDNKIWVLGGCHGNDNMKDVWYSEDGITWHELKNTPWPERHAGSVFNYDKSLWMVSGNLWNDSWRLNNLVCDDFITQPLSQTATPSGTVNFTTAFPCIYASYKWQTKSGGSWIDLNDNNTVVGSNSGNLKLSGLNNSNNGQKYRCVVSSGACSDTSNISILTVESVTGLQSLEIQSDFSVYPNPARDIINVQLTGKQFNESIIIQVTDLLSKVLIEQEKTVNENLVAIDINGLLNGVYLVNIKSKDGYSFSKKIVVSK